MSFSRIRPRDDFWGVVRLKTGLRESTCSPEGAASGGVSPVRRRSAAARSGARAALLFGAILLAGAPIPRLARASGTATGTESGTISSETADAALFARILRRNRAVRDFTAEFRQTLVPRGLAAPPTESGHVYYKAPRLMRWVYDAPERKLAISDGATGWLELPDEHRVIRVDLEESFGSGPVAALFSGGVEALGEFSVESMPAREGTIALRLKPRRPVDEFDSIELTVRADTLAILQVDIVDPGGNRMSYRFLDLRENVGLPATMFEYEPPDNYEVVGP